MVAEDRDRLPAQGAEHRGRVREATCQHGLAIHGRREIVQSNWRSNSISRTRVIVKDLERPGRRLTSQAAKEACRREVVEPAGDAQNLGVVVRPFGPLVKEEATRDGRGISAVIDNAVCNDVVLFVGVVLHPKGSLLFFVFVFVIVFIFLNHDG